jgi:hypothetical protein
MDNKKTRSKVVTLNNSYITFTRDNDSNGWNPISRSYKVQDSKRYILIARLVFEHCLIGYFFDCNVSIISDKV